MVHPFNVIENAVSHRTGICTIGDLHNNLLIVHIRGEHIRIYIPQTILLNRGANFSVSGKGQSGLAVSHKIVANDRFLLCQQSRTVKLCPR